MAELRVLNTSAGADFTCIDCGQYVCAAVKPAEPVCLHCEFLRVFPPEERDALRRRLFPNYYPEG